MQKLEERHTNTPTNAPQVRSNCDSVIKHGCNDQVLQNIKTVSNNSDVDRQSGKTEQDLRVPVLNMRGNPLMPTTPAKARHLLEKGKAKVVTRKPFTIQLKYQTGETRQPITLGIDAGYQYVGLSAVSNKKELFSAEVTIRIDIPKKLQKKAMYRRLRRNRLWYRKPRFLNRKKEKGWLAPSIQHKLDTHIQLVEKIKHFLPITNVIVEVASFDIQKIKNPNIKSDEYQHGEQLGFWNIREYVLHRDNHTCQHCKGKKNDKILEVHHINGKKEGATDRPKELMTVCKTCHDEHHNGINIIPKKKIKNFKAETFMSTIRWKLVNTLNCNYTYGYITKHNRIKQGIKKSHVNDAFIIAGGTNQERCKSYNVKQFRRNNRKLQTQRKGFKRSIRKKRHFFQPNDLVSFDGKEHRVNRSHSYGFYVILDNYLDVNVKKIQMICYGKGIQFMNQGGK
ncbi:MAG: RNA-guided endonuclease IscB [Atribacterota bacterium]